jgi:uridine phosphorylase
MKTILNNPKVIVDPLHFVNYALGDRISLIKDIHSALFCFDDIIYRNLKRKFTGSIFSGLTGELYLMANRIALAGKFGIGCPATIAFLEELVACGLKRFIGIGSAGALHDNINHGDVVLCTGAFSDEGTSIHYPGYNYFSKPSLSLNTQIERWFQKNDLSFVNGNAWTTDTPYRETKQELERFVNLGADVVEMESSAMFIVGHFRKVETACIFVISDSISGGKWKPVFRSKEIKYKSHLVAIEIIKNLSGKPV